VQLRLTRRSLYRVSQHNTLDWQAISTWGMERQSQNGRCGNPVLLQVPGGFSAAQLGAGALDASSERAARQSAAEIFARRFVAVRLQVNSRARRERCLATLMLVLAGGAAAWRQHAAELCRNSRAQQTALSTCTWSSSVCQVAMHLPMWRRSCVGQHLLPGCPSDLAPLMSTWNSDC
jgi:hypothetical protein